MKVTIGPPTSSRSYLGDNPTDEQKVDVKIEKHDTWNMDQTLAHIIAPMLRQLKETTHSAPPVELEDVPEHLNDGVTDFYFERWDWVLDEMIFAFDSKIHDFEEQFFTEEGYDDVGCGKMLDRIANGFRLFGKYYQNLWD